MENGNKEVGVLHTATAPHSDTNSSLVNTILCFDEELSDVFVLNRGAPNNVVVAHCKVTSDMHAIIAEFNVHPHSCLISKNS